MRVYVAGAISSFDPMQVFENLADGIQATLDVVEEGMSPFCPFIDFQYQLCNVRKMKLAVEHYYKMSLEWMDVADVVYVHDRNERWRTSKGTLAEIERAKELGIEIVFSINELLDYKTQKEGV